MLAKSCLMVGTQQLMKNFQKILVFSTLNRGPKFKKIRFFRGKCLFSCYSLLYATIWLPCNIPFERTL